jgi:hypothetical protein
MRHGRRFLLLAVVSVAAFAAVAQARSIVLPTSGHYGGATKEESYRFVTFRFTAPTSHKGGEITQFTLWPRSCKTLTPHACPAHRVILDRGHVSNDGHMSTSQNGVNITATWRDDIRVSGTIGTGHAAVHYDAALDGP